MAAERFRQIASTFKTVYDFSNVARINWFPGHMTKGLRQMQHAIRKTDCVIEVHDARIPFSGRNLTFRNHVTGSQRPHILVLNKIDLALGVPKTKEEKERMEAKKLKIKEYILNTDPLLSDVIFTNCKQRQCPGLSSVLPKAIDLILTSPNYDGNAKPDSNVMIIGIPNVGKSSLINLVRSGNLKIKGTLRVGKNPGVTRALETRIRVSNEPLVYLLDTPGIMMPNIKDMHAGMKLACCATLNDLTVGPSLVADYALFTLNMQRNYSYVEMMGLKEPTEDVRFMLATYSLNNGFVVNSTNFSGTSASIKKFPDLQTAAVKFLKMFREGKMGPIMFDRMPFF